jgi:hypothetical protein
MSSEDAINKSIRRMLDMRQGGDGILESDYSKNDNDSSEDDDSSFDCGSDDESEDGDDDQQQESEKRGRIEAIRDGIDDPSGMIGEQKCWLFVVSKK